MCMQDLAISARVTWRTVSNAYAHTVGTFTVIPPNPLRLMLTCGDSGGDPRAFLLTPSAAGPAIGVIFNTGTGIREIMDSISIFDYPGIFNTELYLPFGLGQLSIWEAVMDSDLSKAVQASNVLISSKGG